MALQNEIWLVAIENRTARRSWGQLLFSGQTCAFLDKLSDKQRCHLRDRWRSIKEKPRSGGATSHCRWLEGRSLLRYRHLKYHVESDACLPDPRLIDRSFSAKAQRSFDAATRVDDVGRCPKKRSMCVCPCLLNLAFPHPSIARRPAPTGSTRSSTTASASLPARRARR